MSWIALLVALAAPPQTLVVVTPEWAATWGMAALYRGDTLVWGPVAVHVGHAGLGWGVGTHSAPDPSDPAPRKKEGDGRSPAGVFRVGRLWTRETAARLHCVDDPAAADYGRVVPLTPGEAPPWRSAEAMAMYRVVVEVRHNPQRAPGQGSCIFLHDGAAPTVGCTAMAPHALDALLTRLAPGDRLVQLPAAVYGAKAKAWGLPAAPALRRPAPAQQP